MSSVKLTRELRQAGWKLDRVRGSHHILKHEASSSIIVVPHPKKDLGPGLVAAIRKQAALKGVP